MSQRARAYAYRVLFGAAPLVSAYGIASEQDVALWVALAGTILGVGLAAANTPTKPGEIPAASILERHRRET